MKISTYILLLFMMGWNLTAFAQHDQPTYDIAVEYIREHHLEWGLTDADITDMVLDYAYQRSNNGLHMLYLVQRHQGIEVRNGILNLSISTEGKVLYAGKRFIPVISFQSKYDPAGFVCCDGAGKSITDNRDEFGA
jgi:hypothetical protein